MNSLYRTMFFVPGNDPKKIIGAEIYRPDCIIYDLEDSVSIFEKDSARILVKYAIEIGAVKIVASIETALGVVNSYKIASASKRMLAIGLGAEDFRTDMRMERSEDASEILFARNLISLNAHATGIMAMDYVYSNIKNIEGFRADVKLGKQLGYTGKSVVHPNQIGVVHELYTPTIKEIESAKEILNAYEDALKNASGVTSLNGKMIDKPMVTRAMSILSYAKAAGMEV